MFVVAGRCHVVGQFNDGLYDIIIAADEAALDDPTEVKDSTKQKKLGLLPIWIVYDMYNKKHS